MTKLEKKIYNCAMKILQEAKEKVKNIQTECRYIEIPFFCDGCFDSLLYDKEQEKFTKIKYVKGKGIGTSIEGMNKFSSYFDEIELCEIDISNAINTI